MKSPVRLQTSCDKALQALTARFRFPGHWSLPSLLRADRHPIGRGRDVTRLSAIFISLANIKTSLTTAGTAESLATPDTASTFWG